MTLLTFQYIDQIFIRLLQNIGPYMALVFAQRTTKLIEGGLPLGLKH